MFCYFGIVFCCFGLAFSLFFISHFVLFSLVVGWMVRWCGWVIRVDCHWPGFLAARMEALLGSVCIVLDRMSGNGWERSMYGAYQRCLVMRGQNP